ncbi:MAG: hypothetical protein A2020_13695 [Lentisphaerae bacterium GWF2_45_14]|nr:MAG: hypothetical protein A2020_13695 [Lentisphaerae bacterium GWF2_45_14]
MKEFKNTPRIIVADDSKLAMTFYEHILDYLGCEAVLCCNGREALDEFNKEPADLVILDIEMPVMSGLDACREIRKTPRGFTVPIVMVSSHEGEDEIVSGLNAGANDYMVKPVREAHLIAKLKTFLRVSSLHKKDIDMVRSSHLFAGRYRMEKLIGYGAHSVVFKAFDIQEEEKPVAVKILNERVFSEDIAHLFAETAGKIKEISCDNILSIYDFGQFGEQLYLVLEFAAHGDLAFILKKGTLSEYDAVKIMLDMVKALKELSLINILHLDIKPENILYDGKNYKLGDFGFTPSPDGGATIPVKKEIWGSAAYMAPEVITGEDSLSIKADIYSLGLTVFEALTGDNPFYSEKAAVSIFRQLNVLPPGLRAFGKNFSPALSDIIELMLSKNTAERPDLQELELTLPQLLELMEQKKSREDLDKARKEAEKNVKLLQSVKKDRDVPPVSDEEESIARHLSSEIERIRRRAYRRSQPQRRFHRVLLAWTILGGSALLSLAVGLILYRLLWADSTVRPPRGAKIVVMGVDSGKIEEQRILDMSKAVLRSTGEKVGYAYQCEKCGRHFPVTDEAPRKKSTDPDTIFAGIFHKCPSCDSFFTIPVKPQKE